jgi:hypothetical protein
MWQQLLVWHTWLGKWRRQSQRLQGACMLLQHARQLQLSAIAGHDAAAQALQCWQHRQVLQDIIWMVISKPGVLDAAVLCCCAPEVLKR